LESDRALFAKVFLPRWMTGNAVEAEDIVQEASLQAFRSIRDCSGTNTGKRTRRLREQYPAFDSLDAAG
jgi:DNA-directed RNA polymerase specialized sigma24 family protein